MIKEEHQRLRNIHPARRSIVAVTPVMLLCAVGSFLVATAGACASGEVLQFFERYEAAKKYLASGQTAQAEDKFLGAIAAVELNDESAKQNGLASYLTDCYCKVIEIELAGNRISNAERLCRDAFHKLGSHINASERELIEDELFDVYIKTSRWPEALNIFFKNYSKTHGYHVPAAIKAGNLSLESIAGWFKQQSQLHHAPQLYEEFCKLCLKSDPCGVDAADMQFRLAEHLVAEDKIPDAVSYLEKLVKTRLYVGTSEAVTDEQKIPEQLAVCYQFIGKKELAARVRDVSKARDSYPNHNINQDFNRLLYECEGYIGTDQRFAAQVKLAAARKIYRQYAFPGDIIGKVRLKKVEAEIAEHWNEAETARQLYKACLQEDVPASEKLVCAEGLSRIYKAQGNAKLGSEYAALAHKLKSGN